MVTSLQSFGAILKETRNSEAVSGAEKSQSREAIVCFLGPVILQMFDLLHPGDALSTYFTVHFSF